MKTPSLSSGYMEGDVARFDCFQTHWIKGDNEYKCDPKTILMPFNTVIIVFKKT